MLFSTIVTAVVAAAGLSAAAVTGVDRRGDPHKCDFRTFGVAGCSNDNQGVYTLLQSDAGSCRTFQVSVGSVLNIDVAPGCTLKLFSDTNCRVSPVTALEKVCQNKAFGSYRLDC